MVSVKKNTDNQLATKGDLKDLERRLTLTFTQKFATKDDLKDFATKNDLKKYATKNDLKKNTNLIIEELSRDIRNAIQNAKEEIVKAVQGDDVRPRLSTLEINQDNAGIRIIDHEQRITKVEATVFPAG